MSSRGGPDNRRTRRVVTTSRLANNTEDETKFTFNRTLSFSLVLLFVCVIALQVTCTLTIWTKHKEMVDKFDCTDENCCPLFIDFHLGEYGLEYGSNVFCYFAASTACSIVDGLEVTMAALVTCAVSMVVSLGKSETCNSLEDYHRSVYKDSESCADIYLYGSNGTHHTVRVHFALLLAEISSWTAVAVMSLIAILSWSRVFSWATRKWCSKPEQPVTRPQVIRPRKMAHGYRLLQDDDNDVVNDDDDEPLPL